MYMCVWTHNHGQTKAHLAPPFPHTHWRSMHTHTHTYACTCTHTYVLAHAHTHKYAHTHAYAHTGACTHTQAHTDTHIMWSHTPVYAHICERTICASCHSIEKRLTQGLCSKEPASWPSQRAHCLKSGIVQVLKSLPPAPSLHMVSIWSGRLSLFSQIRLPSFNMGGATYCLVVGCTARISHNKGLTYHNLPKKGVDKDHWRRELLQKINRADKSFSKRVV